jgi:hypothetical protein
MGITRPLTERTEVKPIMTGIIDTIYFKEGEMVNKDAVILRLKDPNTKAMLDEKGIGYKMKCDSWFMKFLNLLILPVQRKFMTNFTTVMSLFGKKTLYFPSRWGEYSAETQNLIIAHELIHVKQQEKYNFLFKFLYFCFPLPIFWTCRYYFEREAYLLNFRKHPEWLEYYVEFLTGPDYFWAGKVWPGKKRTRKWFLDRR